MGNRGFYGFSSSGQSSPQDQMTSLQSIPGLVCWLKADWLAALGYQDGGAIATWNDFSGQGNDGSQTTAASQPLLKTNIINGFPAVRVDGSNDFFATPFATLLTVNFTIVTVFKMITNPASVVVPFRDGAGGNGTAIIGYNTNSIGFYRINQTLSPLSTNLGTEFGTSPHVIVMMKDGTAASVYRDGALRSSFTTGAAISVAGSMYFGQNGTSAFGYPNMDYGEYLLFNRALTADELSFVTMLEKAKWGIP